jgi:LAGLIDADG DNA endonuclease family protein
MDLQYEKWECAYLAGLFDGEGSVTLNRNQGCPCLSLGNTSLSLMEKLQQLYPGNFHTGSETRPNRKKLWTWQLQSAAKAYGFLLLVFPFLTAKKNQAKIGLDMCREIAYNLHGPRMHGLTSNQRIRRQQLITNLRRLNRRGVSSGH